MPPFELPPIVAPSRTGVGESLKKLKSGGLVPSYAPNDSRVDYKKVTPLGETLGPDYFDMIEKQATGKLQEKFFGGPDSLARQQQNMMNKRGLIGSGIEAGSANQLYKTFGDEMVDLQSNLGQKRLETQKELAFKNKDIESQNALQDLAASQKNRDFEAFLSELGLRAAGDEAKTATDFDTKMFEQQIAERKGQRDYAGQITDQMMRGMENEKLDVPFREFLRDTFRGNISSLYGSPTPQSPTGTGGLGVAGGPTTPSGSSTEPTGEGRFNGDTKIGSDGRPYEWGAGRWHLQGRGATGVWGT